MKKFLLTLILCGITITFTTSCSKENKVTLQELHDVNNKINEYFSLHHKYNNLSFNYVDEANRRVVVGLLNNSQKEQEKFKQLVIDSPYIVFVKGESLTTENERGKI